MEEDNFGKRHYWRISSRFVGKMKLRFGQSAPSGALFRPDASVGTFLDSLALSGLLLVLRSIK
jgi:hypothetical protein